MADELVLERDTRGDWTVVAVRGEVDLYTAPRLKELLAELTSAGQHRIAVDLGQVEFMDSTGLGVLVGALKRCKEGSGALALIAPRDSVSKVLTITGLDKVFSIHDSVDAATT